MNEEQKKQYKEKYYQEKQNGVKFWPDIIYKDLVISIALFIILVILATWVGVSQAPKADPSDSAYVPRPEWYFLFLFQLLKYFPGKLEFLGTTVIPIIAVLALFLLPFFDRNPRRFWKARPRAFINMSGVVVGIVGSSHYTPTGRDWHNRCHHPGPNPGRAGFIFCELRRMPRCGWRGRRGDWRRGT
jgi:quinol-cytochrome oxidoreductase complex cytochrome b subunit